MKTTTPTTRDNAPPATVHKLDRLEERFARKLLQHIDADTQTLSYTASERLRAARVQALAAAPANPSVQLNNDGTATAGFGLEQWFISFASILALLALLFGAVQIVQSSKTKRIQHIAQVDTQLLSNDLPLSAYTDPAFEQFLQNQQLSQNHTQTQ